MVFQLLFTVSCKIEVLNQKDDIDRLFTLVDRASRNALRGDNR